MKIFKGIIDVFKYALFDDDYEILFDERDGKVDMLEDEDMR